MTSAYASLAQNGPVKGLSASSSSLSPTVTALSRWSVANKQLPAVDAIKALHIYDFDNTLFKTPLPNPTLWNGLSIGTLSSQDVIINGGWWHDSRILAATGEGVDVEEKRAWDGWWNEKIVSLVRLSNKQKDALCVLLTGRSERGFAELIKKMINSKGLDFDMVGLKPAVSPTNQQFTSTMHFKQLFLEAMMETYKNAEEIRIYEDRPKHVKGFRDFMAEYNQRQQIPHMRARGPISAEVVQVADISTTLDPVVEVAEVQHMINAHNAAVSLPQQKSRPYHMRPRRLRVKKTVFFTGYMLDKKDTEVLTKLAKSLIPADIPGHDLKFHANNILICPRPCPASILEKVGGMGAKMRWEVTGTSCFENSVWAACLRPVPATAKFHTDNPLPLVVLALRKGARPIDAAKIQNWAPVAPENALSFTTKVGEKVLLRIEPEDPREDEYESLFVNKSSKRRHGEDGGRFARHAHDGHHHQQQQQQQQQQHQHHHHHQHHHPGYRGGQRYHSAPRGGRGHFRGGGGGARGGGNFRGPRGGGRGGRGGGGRGGGGLHGYRSLDDVGGGGGGGGPSSHGTAGGTDLQSYY
ncbi:hypothetical protein SODALDRAFT_283249 [Sodiomyces alkalinus F11]|uniref:Swiss Army Knife RNA repair protein HAD domain-containing protein n=1 Tax=Sodiomyces alkalinus (strain CBS 110278 / VKM F-3762 / F11) TaxID=1314773 RepID=A0A3N2PML2_SODAK|nr:hypothetical protein SODALDRAFT_283249 [Sodiomyces alkalinus F11]ROT35753.1 hypothetical protein SODALDRAFT_283249 [Sodiomyces alkalinus F11]